MLINYLYFDGINEFIYVTGDKFIENNKCFLNLTNLEIFQRPSLNKQKIMSLKNEGKIYTNIDENSLLFKYFKIDLRIEQWNALEVAEPVLYENLLGSLLSGSLGLKQNIYNIVNDEIMAITKTEGKLNYSSIILCIGRLITYCFSGSSFYLFSGATGAGN